MMTAHMKPQPCNILILTASIGSGHLSVARAIAEAVRHISRGSAKAKVRVAIVDLLKTLSSLPTIATKRLYLSSLKISPKIWAMIFSRSTESDWPVKLLNLLSAPFIQKKFLRLIKKKKPDLLVSTFPMWNIIIKKIWDKYGGGKLPFVSVVTDSISIHKAWTTGNPDYFIVPNEDTQVSLKYLGVPRRKIKVFGYPISERFFKPTDIPSFYKKWNLATAKKTLLMILSTGISWERVSQIRQAMQRSKLKNLQLLIIACADERWTKKLTALKWPWPTRVTGWTNEMYDFIHAADIVLTKAGGATVMECLNCQKPIVIVDAIPGQEIGNVMLVQKYNLGVVLNKNLNDFDRAIEYILKNESLIKKNLGTQKKINAAHDVAEFLIGLALEN